MAAPKALGFVVAALALPAPASAAVHVVGSDLSGTPNAAQAGQVTLTQNGQRAGVPYPLSSPIDGVLTSVKIKRGPVTSDPGEIGFLHFRLLAGDSPNFTARVAGLAPLTWSAGSPAGTDTIVPVDGFGNPRGVPISAGERLAVVVYPNNSGFGGHPVYADSASLGASHAGRVGDHSSGGPLTYTVGPDEELWQYTVEPDTDADLFGDDTQDPCVGDPAAECLPAVAVPPPEPEVRTIVITQPAPLEALLKSLAVAPHRFRPGSGAATVSYELAHSARMTFRIERRVRGFRRGRACVRRRPRRPARRCTLYTALKGRLSDAGEAGPNSFDLDGRLRGKPLGAGRYRLAAVAEDVAGNRSRTLRAPFRITR